MKQFDKLNYDDNEPNSSNVLFLSVFLFCLTH